MSDRYLDECLAAIKCFEGEPEGAKVAARFAAYTASEQTLLSRPADAIAAAVDYLISKGAAPFSRERAIRYAKFLLVRDNLGANTK